jgi:hypothetical protein
MAKASQAVLEDPYFQLALTFAKGAARRAGYKISRRYRVSVVRVPPRLPFNKLKSLGIVCSAFLVQIFHLSRRIATPDRNHTPS